MWDRKTEVTIFKNGFSSVWKKLEHMNVGPIIWVDMDSELSNYFRYPKGIAYVSVYYKSELYKVLTWAKQRPDVEFHIGGPIVDTWHLSKEIENSLPNIKSHHKVLIEEVLFQQDVAPRDFWDLKLPPAITGDIAYGFSISKKNGCWWRKCTFCKQKELPIYLNYSDIPVIDYSGTKHIWINTYCMRPKDILNIYPYLPDRDDVRYASYLKLTEESIYSLSLAFEKMQCDTTQLAFNVGIEFPIDRILKLTKRGVTLFDYINGLNFLLHHRCKIAINLILRTGIIESPDLDDVRYFTDGLALNDDLSNVTLNIYRLHVSPERPIWNYFVNNGVFVKPTHNHVWDADLHIVKMTDEQMDLDNQILNMYKELDVGYIYNTIPEGE